MLISDYLSFNIFGSAGLRVVRSDQFFCTQAKTWHQIVCWFTGISLNFQKLRSFFHFILRFWNQILICRSVTQRAWRIFFYWSFEEKLVQEGNVIMEFVFEKYFSCFVDVRRACGHEDVSTPSFGSRLGYWSLFLNLKKLFIMEFFHFQFFY